MSRTITEDGTLSKSTLPPSWRVSCDGPGKFRFRRLRDRFSSECAGRTQDSKKSQASKRFDRALSKALKARTAHLGRKLTRQEWVQMKIAVRKQCKPVRPKLEEQIAYLSSQLGKIASMVPKDISSINSKIGDFALRVDILRCQAIELVRESSTLTETCPHFQKRKLFFSTKLDSPLWYEKKDLPPFSYAGVDQTIQVCCSKCLERREDTVFEWCGRLPEWNDMSNFQEIPKRIQAELGKIKPLEVQSIWSSLISAQMRQSV